jgi:hypothetical protein
VRDSSFFLSFVVWAKITSVRHNIALYTIFIKAAKEILYYVDFSALSLHHERLLAQLRVVLAREGSR